MAAGSEEFEMVSINLKDTHSRLLSKPVPTQLLVERKPPIERTPCDTKL